MTATQATPLPASTGAAPTFAPRPLPDDDPQPRPRGETQPRRRAETQPQPRGETQPRRRAEIQPRRRAQDLPGRRQVAPPVIRPDLRLVDPSEDRRRRRTRVATWILVGLVCIGLFAIVALRVLLAQGQGDVDRLQAVVEAETTTQQQLRLQVAELEAPAQVVAAARSRLGMVTPAAVTYLNPAPPAP